MNLKCYSTKQLNSLKNLEVIINLFSYFSILLSAVYFIIIMFFVKDNIQHFKIVLLLIIINFVLVLINIFYSRFSSAIQIELDKRDLMFKNEFESVENFLKKHNSILTEIDENLKEKNKVFCIKSREQLIMIDNFVKELNKLHLNFKSTVELRDKIQSLNFFYIYCLGTSDTFLFPKTLLKMKKRNLNNFLVQFKQ